jgi:hypothetical protein
MRLPLKRNAYRFSALSAQKESICTERRQNSEMLQTSGTSSAALNGDGIEGGG